MKPTAFITAIALLCSPLTAMAEETHHISDHGDWTVQLELIGEEVYCAAVTTNPVGEILDITVHQDGLLGIYHWFDNTESAYPDQDTKVMIEGRATWTLLDNEFFPGGSSFVFDSALQGMEFALDLQKGTSIALTSPTDHPLSGRFSLRGSKDAIDALYDCWMKTKDISA